MVLRFPAGEPIPSTASELTVNRPVGSAVFWSKWIRIGPLNTYPMSRAWAFTSPASSAISVLLYGVSLA